MGSVYTPEQIGDAIFGQESSSGQADTSQENYAGARGPMQVTKPTFEGLKKIGLIPSNYQHDNPVHTTAAGRALVQHLYEKFDGSPEKVAAAYYAGEKAVGPDGNILNFRDRKNPNAPSTHEYVQSVLGRLGGEGDNAPAPNPDLTVRGLDAQMPGPRPGRPAKPAKATPDDTLPVPLEAPQATASGPLDDPFYQREASVANAARAEVDRVANIGFVSRFQQQSIYNTGIGFLFREGVRPDFEPTPGFRPDPKLFEGLSSDEMEDLHRSSSQNEADYRLMEIADRRKAQADIASGGTFQSLASGLLAGFPEGAVSGMGMARMMALRGVAASQYAARGLRTEALLASAAENIGGNAGLTALQAKFDPYTGAADVGMAMVLGGGFSALEARGLLKTATARSSLEREVDRLTKAAAQERAAIEAKALDRLGPNATPEALSAEARRVESENIRAELAPHAGGVSKERVLVSEDIRKELYGDDAMTGEPVKPAAAAPEAPTQHMEFPTIDENFQAPKGPVLTASEAAARPFQLNPVTARPDADVRATWNKARNLEINDPSRTMAPTMGAEFARRTGGMELNAKALDTLAAEKRVVHMDNDIPQLHRDLIDFAQKTFLADRSLIVSNIRKDRLTAKNVDGDAQAIWSKIDTLRYDPAHPDAVYVLTHELGHLAFNRGMRELKGAARQGILDVHAEWLKRFQGEGNPRALDIAIERGTTKGDAVKSALGVSSPEGFIASLQDIVSRAVQKLSGDATFTPTAQQLAFGKYFSNADEFGAEQFTKYLQAAFEDKLGWKPKSLPEAMVSWLKDAAAWNLRLFGYAKEKGLIAPDMRVSNFFDKVRELGDKSSAQREATANAAELGEAAQRVALHTDDDYAREYGFDQLPVRTPQQRAEYKATADLYRRASDPTQPWNAPDLTRNLSKLLETAPMRGAQSISATMLRSDNPVMRMLATELLESPSGAGGRRTTAAIAKWMHEQQYMGRSMLDVQDAYRLWRNDQGGNVGGDIFNGKLWNQFNRHVAEEIENRRWGRAVPQHDSVIKAADSLEASYERMRVAQIDARTVGWAGLPSTSRGYMPHRMAADRVRNLTNSERNVLRQSLREQFQEIEGFDTKFSADLADSYLERVRERAVGEIDPAVGIHQVGAADIVEDALKAMNMKPDEVRAMMQKYMRGAPGYTKRRLTLDLTKPYETADGTFSLMDVYATNQLDLLRSQARRVSGETALARHGIMGKPGMSLMRRAAGFGGDGSKAQPHELRALDQAAAEFFGDRFGTQGGKWMDRALQVTSLSRLGGMGFTQFAESINMVAHVGVVRALASIGSLNRLRQEAVALARGEKVENSILSSLEQFGGAEFGTENRKMVFPFDNPDLQYQTFGHDTEYAADRLLRGGVHLQGKLSLWQAVHGAQVRGAAEQIVKKAFEYIQTGKADKALDDMGISANLRASMRDELDKIAKFDGDRLVELDITKMENKDAAEEFVQSVHRGASQIIQGTFIGERGAWAHDAQMKLLTQFRTFSLTSIEKQWARQVNIGGGGRDGHARAAGILIGAMSMAAPIYIARTYVQSLGRSDREAYLERRLDPQAIARATMNYIALTGLAGDFYDAASQVTGVGVPAGPRGGNGERDFFGDLLAPSVGVANDLYKGLQNTKEGTDPTKLMRTLPFSNLPFVMPVISSMGH